MNIKNRLLPVVTMTTVLFGLVLPEALLAATPTSIEVKAKSEADDAGPNPDNNCAYSINHNEIYFGECFDGTGIISGFRFSDIPIPRGAFITSAYIEFTVDGPYDNPLALVFKGEATGNAQPFSDSSRPDDRALTKAVVPWAIPASDHWEYYQKRQTPNLAAVVQEIVNRQDWSKGNTLAIMVGNARPANGLHRRVFAFERGAATGDVARLIVNFIAPPIAGCINHNDSPLKGSRVWLIQNGKLAKTTTDNYGCYYFGAKEVASRKKFRIIIDSPAMP